jgi:hypothetical protein
MNSLLVIITAALMLPGTTPQQAAPPAHTPNTFRLPADAARPPAKIADMAWLAGQWTGEFLGGTIDEAWSEPSAGAMVGFFRLVKDGKPVFYEILTLMESGGSVEMRLKHVNPDMTGWEEKKDFVTFRLVRQDAAGVYFDGLTFRRAGPDAIDGFIALRDRATGELREEKLTYRRAK